MYSQALRSLLSLRRSLAGLVLAVLTAGASSTFAAPHPTGARDIAANPSPVQQGGFVTLSCRLVDLHRAEAPIVGKEVVFYVNWTHSAPAIPVDSAITVASGLAAVTVPVPMGIVPRGRQVAYPSFFAKFAGDKANGPKTTSGRTFEVSR